MEQLDELADDQIKLTLSRLLKKGHPHMGDMPIYMFIIRRLDGQMVGVCNLQAGHDERLLYTGNMGYGVWEEYRGQHYALRASRLMAKLAGQLGMTELYLTTDIHNIPSVRTCQALGAENLGIWEVPVDHPEYLKGVRKQYRFRLALPLP